MKKKLLFNLFIVSAFTLVFVSSCKKKDDTTSTPQTLDSQSSTHNDDANFYKSESDQSNKDINDDLQTRANFYPKNPKINYSLGGLPCGATVDTSQIASKILIYNFDGTTNCWGRTRSGSIKVQLTNGNHWVDSLAVLTITYINFKVTRPDGKFVNFNGTKTLTDVNGFNLLTFYTGASTFNVRERADSIKVDFSSGLKATWNTAHLATWSFNPSNYVYTFSAVGDTTINGHPNTGAWGINRFGHAFITHYTSGKPIIYTTACGSNKPVSGELVHLVNGNTVTLTLGVKSDGTLHTGSGCPWGFKVAWVLNNGNNGTANFMYW